MRRFGFLLVACCVATSATAAEVEIITAARSKPVKTEAPVLRVEPVIASKPSVAPAPIKVASLVRPPETVMDREVTRPRKTEAPVKKTDPAPIKVASLPRAESGADRIADASRKAEAARETEAPRKAEAVRKTEVVRKTEAPSSKLATTLEPVRAVPAKPARVAAATPAAKFTFKDRTGRVVAAPIVDSFQKTRIIYPLAKLDPRINPRLARAASIAQERAHAHSKSRCWRYVKQALLASGVISSYPKSAYAKEAAEELVRDYGFKKLPIRDPYKAPIGAVLVYGSRRAAGHVEIRTKTGFVSDFQNKKPSPRPLIGIYAKA